MTTQGLSKRIKALQFAFLSPDEIRCMSGVKIITADTSRQRWLSHRDGAHGPPSRGHRAEPEVPDVRRPA